MVDKEYTANIGLLQGWLDIGAMVIIGDVLHLGRTNITGLLFVNLYFYIFNQPAGSYRLDTSLLEILR